MPKLLRHSPGKLPGTRPRFCAIRVKSACSITALGYGARKCQALLESAHSCSRDVETALFGPEELHLEGKVDEEVRVMCTRGNPV